MKYVIVFATAMAVGLSSGAYADESKTENVDGFSAKQSEVVIKAFDILSAQMWDQLTDENLATLSQAAAIAMDGKNQHYNPKAAFAFLMRILEVQYDYKPLSELTQKVFKSAVLSLMRGDYRFASESDRVLRNAYEFRSDLRQMREMLKRAKLVEQRKANECLFVATLNPLIAAINAELAAKLKEGEPCHENLHTNNWCHSAYHHDGFCKKNIEKVAGHNDCSRTKTELVKALLNPPACANHVDIAGKLVADAPFITVEQIEKTLNNEDTELAFNMGLAVTDPAKQKTYHLVRDRFQKDMGEAKPQEAIVEDEEFDLDAPAKNVQKHALPAIEAPKTKAQELADFASTMDGPRYKTVSDAQAGRPIAAIGPGPSASDNSGQTNEPQPEAKASEPAKKTGFWNRVLGMFGY